MASRFWQRGVGSALLSQGQKEIAARGIAVGHLYVIASNTRAVAYYERRDWKQLRAAPYELLSIPRVE